MNTGKRLILSAGFVVLSTGWAAAAPALVLDFLNLRSGPGFEFHSIEVIPPGGIVNAANCAIGWCQVNIHGIVGYVDSDYLDFAAPPAIAYAAPPPYYSPYGPGGPYSNLAYPYRDYYGLRYYPSSYYLYRYYDPSSLDPLASTYAEVRDEALTGDHARPTPRVGPTGVSTKAATNARRAKHPKG